MMSSGNGKLSGAKRPQAGLPWKGAPLAARESITPSVKAPLKGVLWSLISLRLRHPGSSPPQAETPWLLPFLRLRHPGSSPPQAETPWLLPFLRLRHPGSSPHQAETPWLLPPSD
ncbi:hypothetical protein NHX12_006085 [Muraenolepis orangiensis]|uniref:Uncharacterized protein n=1 Tax=Muraenolepis orangiensis TaxID=630683 RepID=A0A9Q0DSM8_9TELE|nr:hypothetical protein NHX12_006085 [Muraenolepis orangiensis]